MTGWLAQCFIQGENKTEIVETTWLLRIKVDACIDNWKSTMFGQDTFTHAEQRAGPRKKTTSTYHLIVMTRQRKRQQKACAVGPCGLLSRERERESLN